MSRTVHTSLLVLFALIFALFLTQSTFVHKPSESPPTAQASCSSGNGKGSSLSDLYGWAWSDTLGWICFGDNACPNTGVAIVNGANLEGYAWSDTAGWIQFGGLDTSSMPSGNGTQAVNAQINGTNLKGWAKALSANGNGWDGWISLSGAGYGPSLSGGQGISGPLTGYAWGSNVIGWIDFSNVSAIAQNPIGIAFDPSFVAAPLRVRKGTSTYLSWSATCMSSCSVKDQSGATVPGSNTLTATALQTPPVLKPTTYTLTCLDSNNAPNKTLVQVTVVPSVKEI